MPKGYCNEGSTNAEYLADWQDDTWYPVLVATDEALERIIPGYEIAQIKSKFGGLRYYINATFDATDEALALARQIIADAERECEKIL